MEEQRNLHTAGRILAPNPWNSAIGEEPSPNNLKNI